MKEVCVCERAVLSSSSFPPKAGAVASYRQAIESRIQVELDFLRFCIFLQKKDVFSANFGFRRFKYFPVVSEHSSSDFRNQLSF